MLNYPKLALPDAEETLAFRAAERILRTDPTLSRVVRSWNAWDGSPGDVLEPTFSTCPYLRLAPMPTGSAWQTEGQHRMPVLVGIQVAVAGSNADQLVNLWAAVRRALWPSDPARMATVRQIADAAKVVRPVMTLCGYGVRAEERGHRLMMAEGTLELLLHVNTP